jgi:double zinc ribbon protein
MNGMPNNPGNLGIGGAWSERMKLIRLRRKKENLTFWGEFRLIPRWLVWSVVALYVIAQAAAAIINLDLLHMGHEIFPPELAGHPALQSLALAGIITGAAIGFSLLIFLTAYVNQDAKRRGMNSTLWTLLCLIFFPAYLVLGFVIYLLVREPLPYACPRCQATVGARFNFCPNCKCNLHPACPQCNQEVAETDKFCPNCAYDLAGTKANRPAEGSQTELAG